MRKNSFLFVVMLFATLSLGFASCDNDKGNDPDDPIKNESSGFENGYAYVDLGLPSGLKWATCNVGASKPEEKGDYFAWGETEPKTTYDWSTYKWCEGTSETLTKYNSRSHRGYVDEKTILEPEDDTASVNMGGKWRMPTIVEVRELLDYCIWSSTTINEVNGYKVEGPNGNSIFFPVTGGMVGSNNPSAENHLIAFWSSNRSTYYGQDYGAMNLQINTSDVHITYSNRYYGLVIRAVCL